MLQTHFRHSLITIAVTLAAGFALSGTARAVQINDFDSSVEGWRHDFGGSGIPTHDPTEGSPGNAAGALKLEMNFNLNSIAFTGDLFFPGMNLTGNSELLFDMKIAPNSALDAFGNHGYMNFVSRETDGYNWGNQPGRNLTPATGWRTFSVLTSDGLTMSQTRALTFQLYGGPSQNITGNITVWLDNIRTVPEPCSALLVLSTIVGLVPFRRFLRRN